MNTHNVTSKATVITEIQHKFTDEIAGRLVIKIGDTHHLAMIYQRNGLFHDVHRWHTPHEGVTCFTLIGYRKFEVEVKLDEAQKIFIFTFKRAALIGNDITLATFQIPVADLEYTPPKCDKDLFS